MSDNERKNEIFNAPAAKVGAGGGGIRESVYSEVEKNFGYRAPDRMAPLPSNGMIYPETSPLHGLEEIAIRAMSAREENILSSQALIKQGTVINELVKSCLLDKRINPNDMILGDRTAVMVAIRATGYGDDYPVKNVACPNCEESQENTFDLSLLDIRRLELTPSEEGKNLFPFTLPESNLLVEFKFLTGHDELEIVKTAERRKKKLKIKQEKTVTAQLIAHIVSITGVYGKKTNRQAIVQFVEQAMPAGDSSALRAYIEDHEPGIIMKQWMTCDACSEETEVKIPIGISFFWPNAQR